MVLQVSMAFVQSDGVNKLLRLSQDPEVREGGPSTSSHLHTNPTREGVLHEQP